MAVKHQQNITCFELHKIKVNQDTCAWLVDSDVLEVRKDVFQIILLEFVEEETEAEDAHIRTAPLNLLHLK